MGAYLAIISGLIKFANYVAAGLQQHHDELNGAKAQRGADDAATIETIKAVSAPISKSSSNKLWELNKARFGDDGKCSGP